MVHFLLDDDEEPVIRKVRFCYLLEMPKRERSQSSRRKLFETYLLTSPENQKKIREADEVARKKEERANQKEKKDLLSKNKKKKKVTCRTNTVKARELPTRPRGRIRGRGRGKGRIETPKL